MSDDSVFEDTKIAVPPLCPVCDAYNDSTWHHLTAVKSGDTLALYVDGVSSAPDYMVDVVMSQYLNGLLDEVQVYNRALGQAMAELFDA